MSVSELEQLALLAVAFAHRDNPSGIGGGAEILSIRLGKGVERCCVEETEADKLCEVFCTEMLRFIGIHA